MTQNYLVDLITQSVDDGVVYIDEKSHIKIFNPAAVRYSGVTANNAISKEFNKTFKFIKEEGKSVEELIAETITGHDSSLYHHATLVCDEGVHLPIVFRLIPVNDEKGEAYGCLFVFRDYQMDRYKTDFLSLVAHQLKTPLGSMRWNLEALMASKTITNYSRTAQVVGDVYNCNSRLISLVDDLLNASRIDSRKVVNKPEIVKISTVVDNALKELSYQILQKKIIINLKLNADSEIMVDSKHFREVIQNLLSNAIKYNRDNGEINIISEMMGDKVKMSIGDTGIGIPDSELPRIFSKSFRAKNAIDTQIDGSGLGLYVAKSFVEDWGGQIECLSEVGKGTTINFTIPKNISKTKLDKNLSM